MSPRKAPNMRCNERMPARLDASTRTQALIGPLGMRWMLPASSDA